MVPRVCGLVAHKVLLTIVPFAYASGLIGNRRIDELRAKVNKLDRAIERMLKA